MPRRAVRSVIPLFNVCAGGAGYAYDADESVGRDIRDAFCAGYSVAEIADMLLQSVASVEATLRANFEDLGLATQLAEANEKIEELQTERDEAIDDREAAQKALTEKLAEARKLSSAVETAEQLATELEGVLARGLGAPERDFPELNGIARRLHGAARVLYAEEPKKK